jgi:hypothetical protein
MIMLSLATQWDQPETDSKSPVIIFGGCSRVGGWVLPSDKGFLISITFSNGI